MKLKSTVLMLAVAIAIPSMAMTNVKSAVKLQDCRKATNVVANPTIKDLNVNAPVFNAPKADVPEGYASVTLSAGDVWGDGSGYQMLLDADATAYGDIIPETGPLTLSGNASANVYAQFEYKIPENADGALTTSNIVINNSVSILIPAGIYDWCITNPTPNDRMWIASENGNVGGRADNFEFVSGATYVFTVSFGGQNDQVDVVITNPTAPTIPTELAAEPAATSAQITWVAGENNNTWNLRYRPYDENVQENVLFDFEDFDGEDWYAIDADGDGKNWSIWDPISLGYDADQTKMHGNYCMTSASYDNSGALTPDNWLITPEVKLDGTLTFWACGQDPSWAAEHFAVYATTNSDWASTDDFVEIMPETVAAGVITQYTVDLSQFNGAMGCLAFRHFNVTDMFRLNIDDIQVSYSDAKISDWINVEQVSSPHTIQGLTPVTTYEVQVQGVNDAGATTNWTEPVIFTTLEESIKYYITGGFNNWNATEPLEITEDGATFDAVLTDDPECLQFKLLTAGEDDWIWIGGIDENGVGYFEITEGMLADATEITLDNEGANFRLPKAGNYTVTLVEDADSKAPIEGIKMVVALNNAPGVAVTDINGKAVKSVKYVNIAGIESAVPFDGLNIVVTTFTDGTKAATKVVK